MRLILSSMKCGLQLQTWIHRIMRETWIEIAFSKSNLANVSSRKRVGKLINRASEWWLSLLSKAFELTAFEHRRCRPSPHTSLTISSSPFTSEAFPSLRSLTAINHFSFAQDSPIIWISVLRFLPPFSSSVCSNPFCYLVKSNLRYL